MKNEVRKALDESMQKHFSDELKSINNINRKLLSEMPPMVEIDRSCFIKSDEEKVKIKQLKKEWKNKQKNP